MLEYVSIWGLTLARMVGALIQKSEGRRFDRVIGILH